MSLLYCNNKYGALTCYWGIIEQWELSPHPYFWALFFFPIRPQSTKPLYKLCSDKSSVALIRMSHGVKLVYQLIECKPSSPADRWFTSGTQLADHALVLPYLICSTLDARCRSLCKLLLQPSSTPAPPFCCFWLNQCHAVTIDACSVGVLAASLRASSFPCLRRKNGIECRSSFMLSTYAHGRTGSTQNRTASFKWLQ